MIPFVGTQLDSSVVGQVLQTFAITDSLLSVAVTYTMGRKAMARWRGALWKAVALMWAAIILPIVELSWSAEPVVVSMAGTEFSNPLTKLAVVVWLVSVARLLEIEYRIFTLDLIKFDKGGLGFQSFEPNRWGVQGIDKVLSRQDAHVRFPIVVAADESSRPWNLLQRFVAYGLAFGEGKVGAIYFTFTRPADIIYHQLEETRAKLFRQETKQPPQEARKLEPARLVIIDCYSEALNENVPDSEMRECAVILAHPNNPHLVNMAYENALRLLTSKGCKSIRVVYDALSDFLMFTDLVLATQYLRHNMIWEEEKKVESLYLLRSGTLKAEVVQYFRWFADGVLQLDWGQGKQANMEYLDAEFRGPFNRPVKFRLRFDYELEE